MGMQALVQSLRAEMAALESSVAEKDEQIERWSKEAARAQKALEQGSGTARELAEQACSLKSLPSSRQLSPMNAQVHSIAPEIAVLHVQHLT